MGGRRSGPPSPASHRVAAMSVQAYAGSSGPSRCSPPARREREMERGRRRGWGSARGRAVAAAPGSDRAAPNTGAMHGLWSAGSRGRGSRAERGLETVGEHPPKPFGVWRGASPRIPALPGPRRQHCARTRGSLPLRPPKGASLGRKSSSAERSGVAPVPFAPSRSPACATEKWGVTTRVCGTRSE